TGSREAGSSKTLWQWCLRLFHAAMPPSITSEVIGAGSEVDYRGRMLGSVRPVADLLRDWRQRRRLSQLHLALEAEISARHLSFLETGRARPSREMVLRLAAPLQGP